MNCLLKNKRITFVNIMDMAGLAHTNNGNTSKEYTQWSVERMYI